MRIKPAYRNGHAIGLGVYAARDIPPCTAIGRYRGNLLTKAQLEAIYPDDITAQYALKVGRDMYLDAPHTSRSIGRFFNTCDHPRGERDPACTNNAALTVNNENHTAYVRACGKQIRSGDEINVGYVGGGGGGGPENRVYGFGDRPLVPGKSVCNNVSATCRHRTDAPPIQTPRGPGQPRTRR